MIHNSEYLKIYSIGDKVQITGRFYGHGFRMNDIVEIQSITRNGIHYKSPKGRKIETYPDTEFRLVSELGIYSLLFNEFELYARYHRKKKLYTNESKTSNSFSI